MKKKLSLKIGFLLIFIVFFTINIFLFEKKQINYKNAIFNIYSQSNINLENDLGLKGEIEKYKKIKEEHIVGKGFFINKYGEFLSSKHIFDNDLSSFYVKINNHKYNIKLLNTNENKDIVLGKINYKNENYLNINFTKHDYLIYENQKIYIINNNKMIYGEITGLNENIKVLNLNNLIKTNIKLFPGDSGSPVFNDKGVVIGIFTAIKKGEKISFFEKL